MDEYEYDINGLRHTSLMTAEHAKRVGATKVDRTKARTPVNKARTAENKGSARGARRATRDT